MRKRADCSYLTNDEAKIFTDAVKFVLHKSGYSQSEMARRLGVTRAAVSLVLKGREKITVLRCRAIMDVSVEMITDFAGESADVAATDQMFDEMDEVVAMIRRKQRLAKDLPPEPTDMEYAVKDISKMLGVGDERVRVWIRSGELHARKKNKRTGYRITEAALLSFVEEHPTYFDKLEAVSNERRESGHGRVHQSGGGDTADHRRGRQEQTECIQERAV